MDKKSLKFFTLLCICILTSPCSYAVEVTDYDSLKSAILSATSEITLSNDITTNGTISIPTSSTITLDGNSHYINSNGHGNSAFNEPSNTNFTLKNITFKNNSAKNGGVFYNSGTLSIYDESNVVFSNNTATSSGGAIYIATGATLSNTSNGSITFSNNSASNAGGAIDTKGNITLYNATFNNNTTTKDGTDVKIYGGGAIFNNGGTLSFYTSKFDTNNAYLAGGAISSLGGSITSNNTTFSNNSTTKYGGAIFLNEGSLIIKNNSSFKNNYANISGGAINLSGGVTTLTINDSSFSNNYITTGQASAQVEGGGAIMTAASGNTITNSTFTQNTSVTHGGAIALGYNGHAPSMTVTGSTFTENKVEGTVNASLNVMGGGAIANKGGYITINSSTFDKNSSYISGGAINNLTDTSNKGILATTTITNSHFNGNKATTYNNIGGYGGAIYSNSGTVSIDGTTAGDTTFDANVADVGGGAIYANSSSKILSVNNTKFTNNKVTSTTSTEGGGAIASSAVTQTIITNSTFDKNTSSAYGGAFFSNGGSTIELTRDTFTNNTTEKSGGAVNISSKVNTVNINNSDFENNQVLTGSTDEGGGALMSSANKTTITNSIFKNNSSATLGGAIYHRNGTLNINSDESTNSVSEDYKNTTLFEGNTANGKLNGLYIAGGTVNFNTSTNGKIIFNDGISSLSSNTININTGSSLNTGEVILNNTVSNTTLNLGSGTLSLLKDSTKLTGANIFDNSNLILRGGTLNLANNSTDTVNLNNLTIYNTPNLAIDINLDSGSVDNFNISGTTSGGGTVNINKIILQGNSISGIVANIANKSINSSVDSNYNIISYEGNIFKITTNKNILTVTYQGPSGGFASDVISSDITNYEIGSTDVSVPAWIGDVNTLNRTKSSFTISGGTNNKSIIANNLIGINVGTYTDSKGNTGAQTLTLDNVSKYSGFDSAIINNGGNIKIIDSTISNNNSTTSISGGNGGAVQNNSGNVTIQGSSYFTTNTATKLGGAIYNTAAGTVNLIGTTIFGNNSDIAQKNTAITGGAIYNLGNLNLTGNTSFYNNSATTDFGGAIYTSGPTTISGTNIFSGNTATISGGAIYSTVALSISGNAIFENNIVAGNGVETNGGGAINARSNLTITGTRTGDIKTADTASIQFNNNKVTITKNSSGYDGGAIIISGTGSKLNISGADFDNNSGLRGGAIRLSSGTSANINNSQFINNTVPRLGGVISSGGTELNILNSYFKNNFASCGGGALSIGNKLTLVNTSFIGNISDLSTDIFNSGYNGGGAISFNGSLLKIIADGADSTFSGNKTRSSRSSSDSFYSEAMYIYGLNSSTELDFNAGNGGSIIFDDAVSLSGSHNINLNGSTTYQTYDSLLNGKSDTVTAPTNGNIIFNDTVKNANLILNAGTLTIGADTSKLTGTSYFTNSSIALNGGTLNLANKSIETGTKLSLNSFTVTNDAYLQLDLYLGNSIDYINDNSGSITSGKTLTINNLVISGDQDGTLGSYNIYQFLNKNSASAGAVKITNKLKTILTSDAGFQVDICNHSTSGTVNSSATNSDALKVTKVVNAGGLPVALYMNKYFPETDYSYNATKNESIDTWIKDFAVYKDNNTTYDTTSNILQGDSLVINGNNYTFSSSNLDGIVVGLNGITPQTLTINNATFDGFTSSLTNNGGILNILDSSFINNTNSAIKNNSGTVNITSNNLSEVKFENNTTDITSTGGTINIAALKADNSIIFNDKITGSDTTNLTSINILDTNLGNIIFNNTVSNSYITLNSGTLSIGSTATEGKTNYFDNVNMNLASGTFNLQNGYIDTLNLKDLTITNTPSIAIDINLSNSYQSDKLVVAGNLTNSGTLNLSKIVLQGTTTQKMFYTLVDKEINTPTIGSGYNAISYNGKIYNVTANKNILKVVEQGATLGLVADVINPNVSTFEVGPEDEEATAWISNNNKLSRDKNVFNINGGTYGKSIIGSNIIGIDVGTYTTDGTAQKLTIDTVTNYTGFDSTLINNGGNIAIINSKFSGNNATTLSSTKDANGGVIQNNSGTVTLQGTTTLSNNTATNLGGAIYNNANLIIKPTNITFSNNTASNGNDIYQTENGITAIEDFTASNGTLTVGSGISGKGTINNTSTATLNLNGDNSNYTGIYNQTGNSNLYINTSSKFFSGNSTISKGNLYWYTSNDISDSAKLVIENSNLVIGNGTNQATLSIKNNSEIKDTTNITINNNSKLNLNADTSVNSEISGSGTLNLSNSKLTLNSNANIDNTIKLSSANENISVISNSTNADNLIDIINKGTISDTKLLLNNTNTTKDLTINTTNITELTFENNINNETITYSGILTNNGNVINTSNLTINNKILGTGTIENINGILTINSDVSGFSGTYTQNATNSVPSTIITSTGKIFSGDKNINSGSLSVESSEAIDYDKVHLGSNTNYSHTTTTTTTNNITNSLVDFKSGTTGANATFTTSTGVTGNYNLANKIDNGNSNNVTIKNSNVTLGNTDYTGATNYNIDNSTIDLTSNNAIADTTFTNLSSTNSKIKFDITFDGTSNIKTDTLTITNPTSDTLTISNINIINDTDNGLLGTYTATVLNGAKFASSSISSIATTAYEYTVSSSDGNITLTATNYADNYSLNKQNIMSDVSRGFNFTYFKNSTPTTYTIAKSLDDTGSGSFIVQGYDTNSSHSILSGKISETQNGSFFNITKDNTNLALENLTIINAKKTGSGSVVAQNNASSTTTLTNVAIKDNASTSNGGAIYNENGTLTVSNSHFSDNSSFDGTTVGKGGAIYNNGIMTLNNVNVDAAKSTTILNDIYQTSSGTTTLNGTNTISSTISGNGTITNNGTLNISADNSNYTGAYNQISGTTNINGKFFNGTNTIAENSTLNINNNGEVSLGNNDTWSGNINLNNGGKLIITDNLVNSTNGNFNGTGGEFDIQNGTITLNAGNQLNDSVKTSIATNGVLNIKENATATIDSTDNWLGTITLENGTLNDSATSAGTLIANSGNLNLQNGSVINLQGTSKIKDDVKLDIQTGSTVNMSTGSTLNLDTSDKWSGAINNNGGTLSAKDLTSNGEFKQSSGTTSFTDSTVKLNSTNDAITGGNLSLTNSYLYAGSDMQQTMNLSNLTMNNSTFNTMNGHLDTITLDTLNINGTNNFAVDLNLLSKTGDLYSVNNIKSDSTGVINISDFNFIGGFPTKSNVDFKIFNANNISNVTFATTNKSVITPIGTYNLISNGSGGFTAKLEGYAPVDYKGQASAVSTYSNQIYLDNMILNHFQIDNAALIADGNSANKYASSSEGFAPYQYSLKDGGLWYKNYIYFETISLSNNMNVHNNSYGAMIGADLPMVEMKHGWKYVPTLYIAYNGAAQVYNKVSMYQNGGQGGIMGTFMRKDFIASILAYGGGYRNETSEGNMPGSFGNWFAGAAAKFAYNLHATEHFTIEPTAMIAYNVFGKQHWKSDYGDVGINSGVLNGITVAPGVNFIYKRDTWSTYATIQYMLCFNDSISGSAGDTNVQAVNMKHNGYLQYGVGITKTWKEKLNGYFQIVLRNGGRTGIGFQLGVQYMFDFKSQNKKIPTVYNDAKVLKSL